MQAPEPTAISVHTSHLSKSTTQGFVAAVGNSKTLSLTLAAERLRGEHGPYPFFRTFDAMDVFPYQCSEQSTSHVCLSLWCCKIPCVYCLYIITHLALLWMSQTLPRPVLLTGKQVLLLSIIVDSVCLQHDIQPAHVILQEIKTVVERAIERQQQYNHHRQKSTVAVVLDEGGLPKV